MPLNITKSFSKKSGKSEEEVERIWNDTKKIVKDEYPDIDVESDRFWSLVNKITQKRLKIQDEDAQATITTTDANIGDGQTGQHYKKIGKKKKKKKFLEYLYARSIT